MDALYGSFPDAEKDEISDYAILESLEVESDTCRGRLQSPQNNEI
jgi:hypothetical protein